MTEAVMLHIHAPPGYYIGQVRAYGHRKWRTVTGPHKRPERALAKAVLHLTSSEMKRARVLFCDTSGYYDPNLSMEAHYV